jgi:chromosome partitioning protein
MGNSLSGSVRAAVLDLRLCAATGEFYTSRHKSLCQKVRPFDAHISFALENPMGKGFPMRIIAIMNQKGGVGKTTTSVNLSAGLAARGRKVCLVDLDPQGHASLHLGVEAYNGTATIYDVFAGTRSFTESRKMVARNLWVVPSNIDLAAAEVELSDAAGRERILKQSLESAEKAGELDYIIFDCPPSLGVLTLNALTAATEVFIPLQPHFLSLQGLSKLFETTALVKRRLNRNLRVSGVILCLYETGTRLAQDITDDLYHFLAKSEPGAPWAGAKIFDSRVRRNIKLAEAPSFGQSIFDYAKNCPGAADYGALAEEVVEQEAKLGASHSSDRSVAVHSASHKPPLPLRGPFMPAESDLMVPGPEDSDEKYTDAA